MLNQFNIYSSSHLEPTTLDLCTGQPLIRELLLGWLTYSQLCFQVLVGKSLLLYYKFIFSSDFQFVVYWFINVKLKHL
jgi:hypothetical protein